jgi:hypothetical protein
MNSRRGNLGPTALVRRGRLMSPQKPSIGLSQSLLEKSGELVVELDWELKLVILTFAVVVVLITSTGH